MLQTLENAFANANTQGDADKIRRSIERKIKGHAEKAVGMRPLSDADRTRGHDAQWHRHECERLIALCERHRDHEAMVDAAE